MPTSAESRGSQEPLEEPVELHRYVHARRMLELDDDHLRTEEPQDG